MENKIYQSCGMPIISKEQLGKNKDGSINADTCTDECASGYNPNCTCENPECHCKEK